MIYSDFLRFQLVGNTQITLLASVPVSGKRDEFVTCQPLHLIYVPVGKHFVDVAKIDLMDMFGKEFPFAQDATLVLTLGFRPKERGDIRPENAVSSSNFHDGSFFTDSSERREQQAVPQNKPSLLSSKLHKRLSLGQEWEVALLELEYDHLWTNFRRSFKIVYILSSTG